MAKRKVTIEDLAQMVAEGFSHTATKGEVKEVKEDIQLLKDSQQRVELQLRHLVSRPELEQLQERVVVLEMKVDMLGQKGNYRR